MAVNDYAMGTPANFKREEKGDDLSLPGSGEDVERLGVNPIMGDPDIDYNA